MKRSKLIVGTLMVFGFVLLLGYLLTLDPPRSKPNRAPFSVENAKPEGMKALYRFYQVRGKKTKIWKQSYQKLPNSTGDLLLVAGPQVKAPQGLEYQALMDWIEKGNRMMLLAPSESDWTEKFQFQGIGCPKPPQKKIYTVEKGRWFQQTHRLNWPNGQCVLPANDHEDILIDEQYHSLMVKKRVGQGEIMYMPETEILLNYQIDQADHLQFSLAIAEWSTHTIWFDETVHPWPPLLHPPSHQHESNQSDPQADIPPPPTVFEFLNLDGWLILLQILLTVSFYLYAKGKRFSAPRKMEEKKKRNSLEYVEAMAKWYQRSKLHKEVIRSFQEKLENELKQVVRIPDARLKTDGLGKVDRYLGQDFRIRYEQWIARMEQVEKKKNLSDANFLQMAIEIQKLRKELYEWKSQRKR